MLPTLVTIAQIASAAAWGFPLALFAPAVWRVWRAPWVGPARPDPVDVLVSPFAFVAALQIGFVTRWLLFPATIRLMENAELVIWAGLYTLSFITATGSVVAWRFARRIR